MTTTPVFPFTIGDAIRRARLDAKLSREEVAVALKVGYRTVCNWETDIFVPRGRKLAEFVQLTGADWLIGTIMEAKRDCRCYPNLAGQVLVGAAA